MTTRPSVDQARAYADALVAWAEGKRVEHSPTYMPDEHWWPFNGEAFDQNRKYRVAPTPPKLREALVRIYKDGRFGYAFDPEKEDPVAKHLLVLFREVSETADAEMAELRRNHDALCRAIDEYWTVYDPSGHLNNFLHKHGARLP